MEGPLEYLDFDRLGLIPKRYWSTHEYCFFLHDGLMQAVTSYELGGAHLAVEEAILQIVEQDFPEIDEVDILEILKADGLSDAYRQHILGHSVLAILGDMHQFLYSSLEAFEGRKFSVGFALLRKVFKEHLLFLCWVLADDKDFIARFEGDVYRTLNNLSKERRIEIIGQAIEEIELTNMFDSETIWAVIFDKNCERGFEPIWQKATHLVTSQGPLKTHQYSLNFVFEDRADDHYFDRLYSKFPYLLIFLVQTSVRALAKTVELDRHVVSRSIIRSMGAYENLFIKGRSSMNRLMSSFFDAFLECMYCGESISLHKAKSPRFYVSERIGCDNCGADTEFPLDWLMAQSGIIVEDNGNISTAPIE